MGVSNETQTQGCGVQLSRGEFTLMGESPRFNLKKLVGEGYKDMAFKSRPVSPITCCQGGRGAPS